MEKVQNLTYSLSIKLEESINNHLAIIDYFRLQWINNPHRDYSYFKQQITAIIEKFPGYQAINFINKEGYIIWVVPEITNFPAKGKDLHFHGDAARFFLESEKTGNDIISGPITLWQGGRGFTAYFPIEIDGEIIGYLNGVFRFDDFIDYSLSADFRLKDYILIRDGDSIISSGSKIGNLNDWESVGNYSISILNRTWDIYLVGPTSFEVPLIKEIHSILLFFGVLFAAILAGLIYVLMVGRSELVQNIRLLRNSQEELEKRSLQQEQILATARRLSASLDLDMVFEQISVNARTLLQAFSCIIFMLEEDGHTLKPVKVISPNNKDKIENFRPDIDTSFSGQAIKHKRSLVFNNDLGYNEGVQVPGTIDTDDTRVIVAPFIIDNEAVGVVCLNRSGEPYNENDQHIAEIFAAYASTAIKNAQTHDRLRKEMDERTQLENQLRQAQKMEAIGQLAGGVAHDFNNKLGGIIGYAELALANIDDHENLKEYLELIIDRGEKSAELVKQLLAFSRQQILNFQTIDINELISRSVKLLDRVIGENIKLHLELAEENLLIMADNTAIEQIILNIAINARDAMPEGGILTIKTAKLALQDLNLDKNVDFHAESVIKMSISDTGVGISEDLKQHIFEPFFTTKSVNAGTGLGLSMVFGLMQQHSGYIGCDSVPGKGTTFNLYFSEGQTDGKNQDKEFDNASWGG